MFYNNIILNKKKQIADNLIVCVPASKSISNRILIIRHLANSKSEIKNLSLAEDTVMLDNFLQVVANKTNNTFYCKNAGTTLRFLLALLSLSEGRWIVDADKRMQNRPLLPLIDILNSLGAEINVSNVNKIFPITVKGRGLMGNKTIELQENLTSQIISALLLISPYIKSGIDFVLPNKQVSFPYIDMTISLVNNFGGKIKKEDNRLVCRQSVYKFKEVGIEYDWSSACFFYLFVVVGKIRNLRIKDLQTSTLQGDCICESLFGKLGVETKFDEKGALLSYKESLLSVNQCLEFDLQDYPDVFPALAVACLVTGKKTLINNLSSLKVKESDRLQNMAVELNKLDNRCREINNSLLIEEQKTANWLEIWQTKNIFFQTYNDHRIAMALSAFAFVCNKIEIENFSCVEKSFPNFWQQAAAFFFLEGIYNK